MSIINYDEQNRKFLNRQIERRKRQIESCLRRLRQELDMFQNFPDPNAASNIVRLASEMARYTQGCQDLRDTAQLPRGIELGLDACAQCGCARRKHHVRVGDERTGCLHHMTCDEYKEPST